MGVARHTTLVAAGDDLRRYAFAQSLVKNKILSNKGVLQSLGRDLSGVVDDASVQLIDILKTMMFQIRRSLFASDPSSAVQQDLLFFLSLQHIENLR